SKRAQGCLILGIQQQGARQPTHGVLLLIQAEKDFSRLTARLGVLRLGQTLFDHGVEPVKVLENLVAALLIWRCRLGPPQLPQRRGQIDADVAVQGRQGLGAAKPGQSLLWMILVEVELPAKHESAGMLRLKSKEPIQGGPRWSGGPNQALAARQTKP